MANTFIAITTGIVGVFVVARMCPFGAHFVWVGFARAAFAVFAGIRPLDGCCSLPINSISVGRMSVQTSRREASIGAVFSLFIGLGILFLSLSVRIPVMPTILFGSIIGISQGDVWATGCISRGGVVHLILVIGGWHLIRLIRSVSAAQGLKE